MTATTERQPNAQLLRDTLADVEANLEDWEQRSYFSCFAAFALRAQGQNPDEMVASDIEYDATVTLGLTERQAVDLFHWENDLDALRRLVEELTS